jgi:hypothetical protein
MEMPTAPIPPNLLFFDALDPLVQRAAALTLKIENRIETFRKRYSSGTGTWGHKSREHLRVRPRPSVAIVRRSEARDLLAPVHAWFTEGLDRPGLVKARALLEIHE